MASLFTPLCVIGWIALVYVLGYKLNLSWNYGKMCYWRTRYFYRFLLNGAYEKARLSRANELLVAVNVGKLFSPYQEDRQTAILQLRHFNPTPFGCRALVESLKREHSQELQLQILDTLEELVVKWQGPISF